MATRNTDVNLVIRARNEADRAINSVSEALAKLLGVQEGVAGSSAKVGAGVTELAATMLNLDKAAGTLSGAYDKAESSASRQAAPVHAAGAAIAEEQLKIADLVRGLETLRAEKDKAFVGPRRDNLTETISAANAALNAAEGNVRRYTASFEKNLSGLQGSRSTLLSLRTATNEVADAQARGTAALERDTEALTRRSAAVQQAVADEQRLAANATAAQSFFNNKFGGPATRGPATDNGAGFGLLTEQFQRLEAEAKQVRDAIDPISAAVERAEGSIKRVQDLARGGFLGSDQAVARERALREALAATIAQLDGSASQKIRAASDAYEAFEARVRKGVEAMREADIAEKRMADDAAALRERLDPLAAVQGQFNDKLARYRELRAAEKISTDELAAAEKHLADEKKKAEDSLTRSQGNRPKVSLFGLAPYETQNLLYQANDVVTQLSSGTSLSRALAQQGGQIFQLFQNRVGPAIAAAFSNPFFIGAAATVVAIGVALSRAADEAERLRGISAELALSADGGVYDAKDIEAQAQALRGYGASIGDATTAMKTFAREGVNPERLLQFGRAAQDLVDVTGTKLPDAAKQLTDAFTGGYEAVATLDEKTNFLTATQREHIKTLFEEGNAQRARAEAFEIFSAKLSEAAAIERGPATEATRSLKKGFNDLLDTLSNTSAIQTLIGLFGQLGDKISQATGNAAQFTTVADRTARIAAVRKEIADGEAAQNNPGLPSVGQQLGEAIPGFGALFQARRGFAPVRLEAARRELAQLLAQQAADDQRRGTAAGDTIASNRQEQAKGDARVAEATDRLLVQGQRRGQAERAITSEKERQLRLTVAERNAREQIDSISPNASDAAKNAYVSAAVGVERRAIAKEDADARKAIAQAREQAISQFLSRVVGAEGGNRRNAAGSSANGVGQFVESTYLAQFAKVYGDTGQTRQQILDTRTNPAIVKGVLDSFTRENARALERVGQQVTAGNLYLSHFLGNAGAAAVLRAPGGTPVDQIIRGYERNPARLQQTLSQNAAYLRQPDAAGKAGKGRYRTADELETFIARRVGDTGTAQSAGENAIAAVIEDAKKKQDDFNLSVQQGNEDRARAIDSARAQLGLQGEALIAEQRRQAIADAELALQQKVADVNKSLKDGETPVVVSAEQVEQVRSMTGALFDLQSAREALNNRLGARTRPVDELNQQKESMQAQVEFLRNIGQNSQADALEKQIAGVNTQIREAIDNLIEFYSALTPTERVQLGILDERQLQNIIDKLRAGKQQAQEFGKVLGVSGETIAKTLGSGIANSFTNFINRVAAGRNVFKSLTQGIREFAANFISSIAQMIVQLLAYGAVVNVLRLLGVPIPAAAPSGGATGGLATSVGIHHTGGVAGETAGGVRRTVDLKEMFSGAMRFHTGGIAGFAPNEVGIIAERGEEILTKGDPRHRDNVGLNPASGGGATGSVKVVNVFDPASVVEQALATQAGEKVLLNHVTRNSRAFKAAIG